MSQASRHLREVKGQPDQRGPLADRTDPPHQASTSPLALPLRGSHEGWPAVPGSWGYGDRPGGKCHAFSVMVTQTQTAGPGSCCIQTLSDLEPVPAPSLPPHLEIELCGPQTGRGNGAAPEAAGVGSGHTRGAWGRCKPAAAPQPPHCGLGSKEGLALQGEKRDWPSLSFHQGDTEAGRTGKSLAEPGPLALLNLGSTHKRPALEFAKHVSGAGDVLGAGDVPEPGKPGGLMGGPMGAPWGLLLSQNSSHGPLALRDLRGPKLSEQVNEALEGVEGETFLDYVASVP